MICTVAGHLPEGSLFTNEWGAFEVLYKTPGGVFIRPKQRKLRTIAREVTSGDGVVATELIQFTAPASGYMVSHETPVITYEVP